LHAGFAIGKINPEELINIAAAKGNGRRKPIKSLSMKYIDEYRNQELVKAIADRLKRISKKEIILMEVCGCHTMAIYRFGLKSLLHQN
jgi:hypothetical protein